MKHAERIYFGAVVITILLAIYMSFKWSYIWYVIGAFALCYAIGYLLDRFGIIDKIIGR